jgi:hypothetical protein
MLKAIPVRARAVTLVTAALLVTTVPARFTSAAAATPSSPGSALRVDLSQLPSWCKPPTVVSARAVTVPEGPDTGKVAPVIAQVVTFNNAGDVITENLAPDSWRPKSATPAELRFFGIPQCVRPPMELTVAVVHSRQLNVSSRW